MKVEIQPIEDALHPGQMKVLEEAARFNVLECGRRFGKTHLGIQLAIDRAIDGGEVGWFAPTYRYLADPWRDIERILAPLIVKADRVEKRIDLLSGGTIDFWSLDSTDAGRGKRPFGRRSPTARATPGSWGPRRAARSSIDVSSAARSATAAGSRGGYRRRRTRRSRRRRSRPPGKNYRNRSSSRNFSASPPTTAGTRSASTQSPRASGRSRLRR